MKCTFQSGDFVRCITDLAKVVPSRPSLPLLSGIFAEVRAGVLHLIASDGEVFLGTHVELAPSSEDGSCVLSTDHLVKLVAKLPAGSTSIEMSGSAAKITWSTGYSLIPVFDAADFPVFEKPSDEQSVTVKPSGLLRALSGTVYATAQDEVRPAMGGVLFEFRPDGSHLVATDAKKLAAVGLETASEMNDSFILHRRVCGILKSLLARESDEKPVSISFDGHRALFALSSYTLGSLLITSKFPNYRAIIPSGGVSSLTVGRKELVALIERTAVCADRSSMMVKLDISAGGLTIQAQDLGFGTYATDSMLVDYEGDPLTIGFNARHFADILDNLTCNTVKLIFNGSNRAALFTPSDEEASILEKAILMPLAISA